MMWFSSSGAVLWAKTLAQGSSNINISRISPGTRPMTHTRPWSTVIPIPQVKGGSSRGKKFSELPCLPNVLDIRWSLSIATTSTRSLWPIHQHSRISRIFLKHSTRCVFPIWPTLQLRLMPGTLLAAEKHSLLPLSRITQQWWKSSLI